MLNAALSAERSISAQFARYYSLLEKHQRFRLRTPPELGTTQTVGQAIPVGRGSTSA